MKSFNKQHIIALALLTIGFIANAQQERKLIRQGNEAYTKKNIM